MPNYVTPTIGTGAVTDTAQTKRLVPELWAKDIAKNRTDNLVLWNLINHEYQGEIGQEGDVLHINFISEITDSTATNSSVTTASTIDSLAVTQSDLLIDRYIRKAVGVQDVAKAQSKYEFRAPYVERLGRFLARALDEEVQKKAAADFSHTVAAGASLKFADIVDAAAKLDTSNVPQNNRVIVVNGVGLSDLRKVAEFTLYDHNGREGVVSTEKGIVGSIYGMPVYVTEAIKAVTGTYTFLMFQKEAIIAATQGVPPLEADREKLLGVDYIVGSQLWGVKTLRPDHGVKITRTATAPSA